MTKATNERFYSVDVETSGPIPGEYSLLSIGACLIRLDEAQSEETFSCRLKPLSNKADPAALSITGLSLDELARNGKAPAQAMEDFADWVARTTGDATPVFVGFNAAFDWSFINYYFHHFLGRNPFGFAALDIKSLYMGFTGCSWRDTRSSEVVKALQPQLHGNHNALDDALAQAELFQLIRAKQQLGQLKGNQK